MFGAFNHILIFFFLSSKTYHKNQTINTCSFQRQHFSHHKWPMSYFPPVQNVPLPGMRWPKWRCVTVKTLCVNCRRQRTKMTWSSSTTECPRRPARPSLTSPTTCVGRIASMSCTSIRPKTTPSCRYKTR